MTSGAGKSLIALIVTIGVTAIVVASCSQAPSGASDSDWHTFGADTTISFWGIWGSSASDVFAVGPNGVIFHFDGHEWQQQTSGTIEHLWAVGGTSAGDVYAVGSNGIILHYDGESWTEEARQAQTTLTSVWAASPTDVYVVGMGSGLTGLARHYDGSNWTSQNFSQYLTSVTGVSSRVHPAVNETVNDIYVVSANGHVWDFDGSSWSEENLGVTFAPNDIWAASWTDIFVVGGSSIAHYDGVAWSDSASPSTTILSGISGTSYRDIYAVGGAVLHFDGRKWTVAHRLEQGFLRDVWIAPSGEVFAAGDKGLIVNLVR